MCAVVRGFVFEKVDGFLLGGPAACSDKWGRRRLNE